MATFLNSLARTLRTLLRRLLYVLETPLIYVFGRDIFISYARADAAEYARELAIGVRDRVPKFSFFLDQWASLSGTTLPLSLRLALRWSQMLVFVGTPNAIGSAHVRMELEAFFNRKGRFVPIDVGGALGQAMRNDKLLAAVCGPGPIREESEDVANGTPSKDVVTRIVDAAKFTRQDQRLHRAVIATTLGVLAIITAGYFVSRTIVDDAQAQASTARDEAAAATEQRQKALRDMGAASFAAAMAQSDQLLARLLANEANKEKAIAEKLRAEAERLRDQARAEARRQGEIATLRQRANQSEITLKQSPKQLADSVSLAVESMQRAHAIDMYSVEADRALRSSLSLLPRSLGSRRISEGPVADYGLSPDGKYIALLYEAGKESSEKNLKIQGVADGQVIAEFRQEETDSAVVALSNDAQRVSVYDGAVIRTRKTSGTDEWELEFTETVDKMALSPNGRYLALVLTQTDIEKFENRGTAQENATFAEVWDVETQKRVIRLPVGLLWLNSVAFSGNGQFLAVGGDGEGPGGARMGRGLVWDLRGARQRGVLTAEDFRTPEELLVDGSTHNVVPASQDGYVAITTLGMATVWKRFMRSGYREIARIPVNQIIQSSAFNAEGNRLILLSSGTYPTQGGEYRAQNVEVWESQGYWQAAKSPHRSEIDALKFQPGDQFITTLTRYGENKVRVWNASDGQEIKNPKLGVAKTAMAEFSTPDIRFVALRDDKDVWSVRDVLAGSDIEVIREPNPAFRTRAVALTPDGTLLVLGGLTKDRPGGWVSIYKHEGSAYRMIKTFPLPAYATWAAISDDGRFLAVSPYANGMRIIDLRSGTDITPANLKSLKQVRSFKFAPNGEYLAIVFDSVRSVESDLPEQFGVWRLRDFRQIATLSSKRSFSDYIFSSGHESLLAVTKDNSIELFNLRSGAQHTLPASSRVRTVAFSAHGRLVAMGNDTGLVTIFETSTRSEIAQLQHEDDVTNITFSNDGQYVATSTRADTDRPRPGEEHLLNVWLLRPTDLVTEACHRLMRFREDQLVYCKR